MKDLEIVIIALGILILFVSIVFASVLREKIATDLILDMAARGYIQKIEGEKTLWIKDENKLQNKRD